MNHIIFSPHLDDAVLCCGGLIAKYVDAGHTVTMHTLFCGYAHPPFSPIATALHEKWGNPPDMVRLRRAEDLAAGAKLGAKVTHSDWQEPIYRVDEQGQWLYGDIFGQRHPNDNHLVQELFDHLSNLEDINDSQLYFPLGIGHHVDHIITFEAGLALLKQGHPVTFYEDFPYTIQKNNYAQRRAELPDFQPTIIPLTEAEITAKIESFLYYRSQIPMLFGTPEAVPKIFREYSQSISQDENSFAVRLWHPYQQPSQN